MPNDPHFHASPEVEAVQLFGTISRQYLTGGTRTMTSYTVGTNVPGYMPEATPERYYTLADAMAHIVRELEDDADRLSELDPDEYDETLPDVGEYDAAIADVLTWIEPGTIVVGNRAYWIDYTPAH
jgi:hypothetical protein